jgi:hypothetical protein
MSDPPLLLEARCTVFLRRLARQVSSAAAIIEDLTGEKPCTAEEIVVLAAELLGERAEDLFVLTPDELLQKLQALKDVFKVVERPDTQQAEGEKPKPTGRRKGTPREEAEILVREWLMKNAKDDPASITRDAVHVGTGISTGQISQTAAWKAFIERRNAEAKPRAREIPLTDTMQAVVPDDYAKPDELAALIEEQRLDEAEENRRHKRRHKPS